jgi:hypothetical protein
VGNSRAGSSPVSRTKRPDSSMVEHPPSAHMRDILVQLQGRAPFLNDLNTFIRRYFMVVAIILAFLIMLTQIGDWYTTTVAIKSGLGKEANPVAKWLMAKLTYNGFFIAKTIFATLAVYLTALFCPVWYMYTLIGLMIAGYSYVLYNNYVLVAKK